MASLAEDIAFGTALPLTTVEKALAKNTWATLAGMGAGWYADDGVTRLTLKEQRAALERMFARVESEGDNDAQS